MTGENVVIEVHVFDGCPHAQPALDMANAVAERFEAVSVRRTDVDGEKKAAALGFLGSPSIRVNGEDVEGRSTTSGAMCCRTYEGGAGVPPEWMVEAAVLRASKPRGLLFLCVANSARSQMAEGVVVMPDEDTGRKLWQDGVYFAAMVGILIVANWGKPAEGNAGIWAAIHSAKWIVTGVFGVMLAAFIWRWFEKDELADWTESSWTFAKQIMPLLFAGVLVAGFLLGGPEGGHGVIPNEWVSSMVGGTSMGAARTLIENKKMSRTMDILRKGAGAVIVLVGVYFGYRGLI